MTISDLKEPKKNPQLSSIFKGRWSRPLQVSKWNIIQINRTQQR